MSVVESKDGNVLGAATHPEKVLFQFTPGLKRHDCADSGVEAQLPLGSVAGGQGPKEL